MRALPPVRVPLKTPPVVLDTGIRERSVTGIDAGAGCCPFPLLSASCTERRSVLKEVRKVTASARSPGAGGVVSFTAKEAEWPGRMEALAGETALGTFWNVAAVK